MSAEHSSSDVTRSLILKILGEHTGQTLANQCITCTSLHLTYSAKFLMETLCTRFLEVIDIRRPVQCPVTVPHCFMAHSIPSILWCKRLVKDYHLSPPRLFTVKNIVACQRGGVSIEPPVLRAATRHGVRDPLVRSQVEHGYFNHSDLQKFQKKQTAY